MEEQWLVIEGTGGKYSVSNKGFIRSNARTAYRMGRPALLRERTLVKHLSLSGTYSFVRLPDEEGKLQKKKLYIAELVARMFLREPEEEETLVYLDNKMDNDDVRNLAWVRDTVRLNRIGRNKTVSLSREHLIRELVVKGIEQVCIELAVYQPYLKTYLKTVGIPINRVDFMLQCDGIAILNSVNEDEQWAYVDGFENRYIVSTKGNIHHLYNNDTPSTPVKTKGAHRVVLRKQGRTVNQIRAVLVARAFIPNPKGCKHVAFKDKDPYNIHISNLEWTEGSRTDLTERRSLTETPTLTSLIDGLQRRGIDGFAEDSGVSEETVLRWCTVYGIPKSSSGIQRYVEHHMSFS